MEEVKSLEERVSLLEDYVERLAISITRLVAKTEKSRNFNPVENTK
jgi:hypothetical protein